MDEELKLFLEDVHDQLELLEEGLVSLEEKKDAQSIHVLFRAAHTLKGISATFGAPKMQELTHQMESVFQKIRDEKRDVQTELISLLLSCVDTLKILKQDIEGQRESAVDVKTVIEKLKEWEKGNAPEKNAASGAPSPVVKTSEEMPASSADAAPLDEEELKLFLEDVDEQMDMLEEELVLLEEQKEPLTIHNLFRAAHTLKGISATFGAPKMQELTHRMESVFQKIRDDKRDVGQDLITALLYCVDMLKALKKDIANRKESTLNVAPLVAKLDAWENAGKDSAYREVSRAKQFSEYKKLSEAASSGKRSLHVFMKLKPETEMPSVRLTILLQEIKNYGEVVNLNLPEDKMAQQECFSCSFVFNTALDRSRLKQVLLSFPEIDEAAVQEREAEKGSGIEKKTEDMSLKGKKTIRLDMERVEALMNITSELVIEKNRLLQISQLLLKEEYEGRPEIKALLESKEQLDKKISFLQDEMLKVRTISLDALFKKFPRAVRDAAVKAGKDVKFTITGASVELDKTVIDELSDPLIHLLRNAVDHGVKEKGEIVLSARQAEGNVFIEVSDNGQGVDLEKVRQKALEKKLIDADQLQNLSDREVLDLIFMPGFSTKENVSDLSGRGVGLDVVRENIKKIHGNIEMQTEKGAGTKFILKIPLTLAIIKSLLVLSSGQKFAIPLSSVHEIVQVSGEEIQTVKTKEAVLLRGNVLPLFYLSQLLDLEDRRGGGLHRKVVVVSYQEKKVGFIIDALLGEQEIVVYTLGKFIGDLPGISGATIDSEGRVALILDVPSLVTSTLMQSPSL